MKPIAVIFLPLVIALAILGGCATRTSYVDLYGSPAMPTSYQPTITITPDMKYVNVEGGQTIRFVANGKEFAWTFNVAQTVNSFYLNEVAPPGMLDHPVHAYVSPDPRYFGP